MRSWAALFHLANSLLVPGLPLFLCHFVSQICPGGRIQGCHAAIPEMPVFTRYGAWRSCEPLYLN